MSLKSTLKKCLWLRNIVGIVRSFDFIPSKSSEFSERIRKCKDEYKGNRCFIIGNGPSLTVKDLEQLKNEYTFGLNGIYKMFDSTDWRPTFFCAQDILFIEGHATTFADITCDCKKVFVRRSAYKKNFNRWDDERLCYMHMRRYFGKNDTTRFSEDISKVVYDGTTVAYSAMQIAAYLGFDEIYLIGMDHKFPMLLDKNDNLIKGDVDKQHFEGGEFSYEIFPTRRDEMTMAYIEARKYCEKKGIKIYNASHGGSLDVFVRKKFEDIV